MCLCVIVSASVYVGVSLCGQCVGLSVPESMRGVIVSVGVSV